MMQNIHHARAVLFFSCALYPWEFGGIVGWLIHQLADIGACAIIVEQLL
jgi:hypothetical protein